MSWRITGRGAFPRVVVKIGSALLADVDGTQRARPWLEGLARDIAAMRATGTEVAIVSSGAIAFGRALLNLARPKRLEEAQAAAAVGQIQLAHAYISAFASHDIVIGQMLLSLDDLEMRSRFLNARNTLESLLAHNAVPVINENDTVATSEIRFGDNDRLAARVAILANADLLVLLSNVDGLMTADPATDADAELVEEVGHIDREVEKRAGPPVKEGFGTGGMVSKIEAARMATEAGCPVYIAAGQGDRPLARLAETGRGTYFAATGTVRDRRKAWIRSLTNPHGFIHIDSGAERALEQGASLLAVGMQEVLGDFDRGELIAVVCPDGHIIGQGLAAYTSDEAEKICGVPNDEIEAVLGFAGRGAMIHRDDLVLFQSKG